MSQGIRLIVIVAVAGVLLALPRLLPDVDFPSWWSIAAVLGPVILVPKSRGGGSVEPLDPVWGEVAQTLGLEARAGRRGLPDSMRGTLDGHRLKVEARQGEPFEIEVDYESGLQSFSIRPADREVVTNRPEVVIGDPEFDARFRILGDPHGDNASLQAWLTPVRRTVISALADGFVLGEVEEDEIELRWRTATWTATELRDAITTSVDAAQVLDRAPIQDA